MQCFKCNLRYNTSSRKPLIIQCGHTLCQICLEKTRKCHECNLPSQKDKTKINYSLLALLEERKTYKQIDKFIKVCFIGSTKVGKTSLIFRLKGQPYRQNTVTTIGYDFAFEDRLIEGMNVRYQLWDSAGQERYRSISPLHYKNADIVVIVYDMTQTKEENNLFSWYQQTKKHCEESTIKILVGNKVDLLGEQNRRSHNNPIDKEMWTSIKEDQLDHFEISCKNNEGIEETWQILDSCFKKVLKQKKNNHKEEIKPQASKSSKLKSKVFTNSRVRQQQSSGGCC